MRDEYDIFMDKYEEKHQCCPKCGSESYTTILVGYPLDMNNKESYKDENKLIKSLHLESTANREREQLDIHLPVKNALIG